MRGRRNNSVWSTLDWVTVCLALGLAVFGWLNIYGAGYTFEQSSIVDFSNRAGKQFVWLLGAGLLATVICLINYRIYDATAYFMYGVMIAVLLVTPLLATNVKGSYSWINIGSFRLQPAEFMKFIMAMTLAKYMSVYGFRIRDWRDLMIPAGLLVLPMFIIMVLQQETGSALVFAAFSLVLYREGMSGYVLIAGLVAAICFVLSLKFGLWPCLIVIALPVGWYILHNRQRLIQKGTLLRYWREWTVLTFSVVATILFSMSCRWAFDHILQDHQQKRIEVLLGMREDRLGVGYNVAQSHIAIGSGGFLGKGYLQGTQTKGGFVPEQDTDFIFCTVGEEWGFVGSIAVLAVFCFFIIRLYQIAERQHDSFARIYGYGVASIFLFHLTINVGMVLGLLPVIGIPLPFFSYGGSSLWSFTIMLFILLRLDAARDEQL